MALKSFSVYLDENMVKEAKKKNLGQKLSPILNELLRLWVNNPNLDREENNRQNPKGTRDGLPTNMAGANVETADAAIMQPVKGEKIK